MIYQNRKDSSVSIRLIVKTTKATIIHTIKFDKIIKSNAHSNIDDILKFVEDELSNDILCLYGEV